LFVEASGVAHADELRRSLEHPDLAILPWKFVTLIDVARYAKLWSELYGLGFLIRPQLAQADLIVVTKTDTVNTDRARATVAAIQQIRPDVPIIPFAADDPAWTRLVVRALQV
jgi:G3E family GTPase